MATDDRVKAACKIVGCKVKDLLKSRLTEDSVILIVGPGYKYIVPFSDLGAPPPATTQVEAKEEPVTASKAPARKSRAKKASA